MRRGIEINPAAGREWGDNDANRQVRSALNKDLEALSRVCVIQASTRTSVDAVRKINNVTSNIAGAIGQQDQATREISQSAQLAAQGNETLVINISSLSQAMGKTSNAAESVLAASGELTAMAETLSHEVDRFFQNLRADPHEGMRKAGRTLHYRVETPPQAPA